MLSCSSNKLFKNLREEDEPLAEDPEAPIPLPFNQSKNPRIVGDLIIINSISTK